ncbi:hypothetical protein PAXRUDRAFT_828816 [Paxillus rubicundulus Ve08.2h10]|uniref:Uncharacterized protein n=1 Tax=Paxillus rubicundulus Ve08.2h10 TaxID=930991 RepID=A0A0D0D9B1_9AGAM|nr:hypothetical protein PAXRUDRAFT_828816 [Paxillus rubicundulus Ve08.2h10]
MHVPFATPLIHVSAPRYPPVLPTNIRAANGTTGSCSLTHIRAQHTISNEPCSVMKYELQGHDDRELVNTIV